MRNIKFNKIATTLADNQITDALRGCCRIIYQETNLAWQLFE